MKNYILSTLFGVVVLGTFETKAQQYIQDINGKPLTELKRENLIGSPFFNDAFLKGSIQMEDNSIYKNLLLRYDQELDQLVYKKDLNSASLQPIGRVVGFEIEMPNAAVAKFKSIIVGDKKKDGFYQVLQDGKVAMLKKTRKEVVESVVYNSKSTEKSMSILTNYYILKPNNELIAVKTDKKSFLKALSDKEGLINTYISKESINFKSDLDLVKIVNYYNSL